jgi:hypothetical protein
LKEKRVEIMKIAAKHGANNIRYSGLQYEVRRPKKVASISWLTLAPRPVHGFLLGLLWNFKNY